MQPKHSTHRISVSDPLQRGMVLIIVLVVIVLLSLGAYTFAEYMVIATRATAFNGKAIQARAMADSGIEFVSVLLADRASLNTVGLYHNPGLFQGHLMMDATQPASRGRFTVVAPVEGDPAAQQIRFGLIDESSKLNLNTIAAMVPATKPATNTANASSNTGAANNLGGGTGSGNLAAGSTGSTEQSTDLPNPLMGIPGMTLEISEAIFDWIDEDDDQRDYGAENAYYQGLSPPYESKNGKLETLDELLLIRGITPQLLFGEDANRNGLLDPNENDGALTAPYDDGDGFLNRGWSAYLTVYSRELNLQNDRTIKIDVNKNTLSDIYDSLEDKLGETQAQFLVAYRLFGPMADISSSSGGSGGGGNSGGGNNRGGGGGGGGSGGSMGNTAQALGQAVAGRTGKVTRGGMDLTNGGKNKINSVYDLVGVQVSATVDGATKVLDSPWAEDTSAMSGYLPELLDLISTGGSDQFIDGRINVNQAHKEVLLGLPGMTEEIAQKIVSAQARGANGEPLPDADGKRSTTMWLLAEGIVDLPTLRKLNPYLTGRGDVFRLQVMGHFDGGGPAVRIEAVIDATLNPPQPIFFRDLSDLGRGYNLPVTTQ